jgi:hypothetical protein
LSPGDCRETIVAGPEIDMPGLPSQREIDCLQRISMWEELILFCEEFTDLEVIKPKKVRVPPWLKNASRAVIRDCLKDNKKKYVDK